MTSKIYYLNGELLNSDLQDIPEGARQIPAARYKEIIMGFQAGYLLGEDVNGDPVAVPPPLPNVDEAMERKKAEVLSEYEAAFAPVAAAYPATEREGWTIQLEEARTVLADPDVEVPTLALMVEERAMGESVADFARLVIANNTFYRRVYASLTGQQQRMYRDVESMSATPGITAAEVLSYPVKYQLPEGM